MGMSLGILCTFLFLLKETEDFLCEFLQIKMDYKRMPPHGLRWMFFSRQKLVQGGLPSLLGMWWGQNGLASGFPLL